jgi:hypothetical protein
MKLLGLSVSIFLFMLTPSLFSQTKKSVKYEYKKYEKFDFAEIGVEGEAGAPGDLSISPRLRNEFRNKLPERENFNREMTQAIEGIR